MSLSVSIFTRCLSPFFYSSFRSYVDHTNMPSLLLYPILTLNIISNLTHARSHSHILCLSFVFSIISLYHTIPLSNLCLPLSCLCLLYVSLCRPFIYLCHLPPICRPNISLCHLYVVPISPSATYMSSQYLPLSPVCRPNISLCHLYVSL